MSGLFRLFLIASTAAVLVIAASGQDLGSSNKLFGGGGKSTAPPKSTKKTAAVAKTKLKTSAPVKKVTVSKKPPASKPKLAGNAKVSKTPKVTTPVRQPSKNPVANSTKPKFSAFKDEKPKNVQITVGGQDTAVNGTASNGERSFPLPAGASADDLFEEWIEKGNAARDDRNYVSAEFAYKRAKTIKSKESRSEYGLGNLYSDQQRWEEAEKAYRAAIILDTSNVFAYVALSYVLTQPLPTYNLSDRYREAESLARRAIQLAPSNAVAFDQMGVALELRGMIGSETQTAYERAIKLDSSFAPAYAHLGRLLRRLGSTKESASAYKEATQRAADPATLVLVAEVLQSELRFADSEPLLKKALSSDPKNVAALLLLGRAYTTLGKFTDAERMLRASLEVSPNGFTANSLLGSLFSRQGKFEDAEAALLVALKSVPMLEKRLLAQQFETVGDGYLKTGKPRNAERAYRQAMSLDADQTSLPGKLAKAQRG